MVFVGGPRQVGKTTFALSHLDQGHEGRHPAYMNWDAVKSRKALLKGELPPNESLVILDEVHKFARWRNLVKGLWDTNRSRVCSSTATGSRTRRVIGWNCGSCATRTGGKSTLWS